MKKIILITGISSGFGKETARLLAEKGHKVYGTMRKKSVEESIVINLTLDLADPVSISKAVNTVIKNEGRIDVLINNAGMHTGGPAETMPEEYIKLQMDTNFMGLVTLTRLVLPFMRNQGGGTIINFSSIGGLMGLPFQSIYSAGKFAIEGFSEAMRMEVKRFNIKVILINPGDFHTSNSVNRRMFLPTVGIDDPYYNQFEKTLETIERDETNGWEPEILAKKIVKIVETKNPAYRYIIASNTQRFAVVLKRILPEKWFSKLLEGHYKIKS